MRREENEGSSLSKKIGTIFLGGIITLCFAMAAAGTAVMIEKPNSDAATIRTMADAEMSHSHISAKAAYEIALKKDAEHSEGQGLIGLVGGLANATIAGFGLYMVRKYE